MATNICSHDLIGFLKDYHEKEPCPTRTYQVTRAEGLHSNKPVGIDHRESTRFLLVKIFDRLEVIRHAVDARWNGPRSFEELEECLSGKAPYEIRRTVHVDAYGSRRPHLSKEQDLSVHGLQAQVHELPLGRRRPSQETYRRTPLHAGTPQHGSLLQHLFGTNGIITDDEFKQVYWDIFPNTMQDWLTNDQNIDPFDPAAPLGVDGILDHLKRYWQLYFKNKTRTQPSNNKNKQNKRSRDNDDH